MTLYHYRVDYDDHNRYLTLDEALDRARFLCFAAHEATQQPVSKIIERWDEDIQGWKFETKLRKEI